MHTYNVASNLQHLHSSVMNTEEADKSVTTMICIAKNTMERRLMTTMITITIASKYVIPSVLYVFHCHHRCLLLLLLLLLALVCSFCVICVQIEGDCPQNIL